MHHLATFFFRIGEKNNVQSILEKIWKHNRNMSDFMHLLYIKCILKICMTFLGDGEILKKKIIWWNFLFKIKFTLLRYASHPQFPFRVWDIFTELYFYHSGYDSWLKDTNYVHFPTFYKVQVWWRYHPLVLQTFRN